MNLFSFDFILFFIFFFVIHQRLQNNYQMQNIVLLIASYLFLLSASYNALFIVILLSLTAFGFAKFLQLAFLLKEQQIRELLEQDLIFEIVQAPKPDFSEVPKVFLKLADCYNRSPIVFTGLMITTIATPLFYFKFFEYLFFTFQAVLLKIGFNPNYAIIVAPLGISYLTFNLISFLVSAARHELPKYDLTTCCLLFAYFPAITAGPLLRAKSYLKQFNQARSIGPTNKIVSLILLGIFLKWTIAANLSDFLIRPIFDNPYQYNSIEVIIACFGYSVQILFDFVAYIAIAQAIGLAFGFIHPTNFRNPYVSLNLKEFWGRWNISVSNWIRDYIYIPLGGNRFGFLHTQIAIVIAMLASAFWHGANSNFLIWGLLHAIGLIWLNILRQCFKFRLSLSLPWLSRSFTFIYVTFTWIFFSTPSLEMALAILESIAKNWSLQITSDALLIFLVMLISFIFIKPLAKVYRYYNYLLANRLALQLTCTPILLVIFIALAPSGVPNFIYANF